MALFVNAVYVLASDPGRKLRLIHVDTAEGTVAFMPLEENAFPFLVRLAKVEEAEAKGELERTLDPYVFVEDAQLSEQAETLHSKRLFYVKRMLNHVDELVAPSTRNSRLLELSVELKVSRQTLTKVIRLWWIGGQLPQALNPQFFKCGCNRAADSTKVALGAPARFQARANYILGDDDRRIMWVCISRYYLRKQGYSLTKTHVRMLQKFYSVRNDYGIAVPLPAGQRPSLKQVRYYLQKNFDVGKILRARKSSAEIALTMRERLGNALANVYGPGHYFELDATVSNVHLVSSLDRSINIGRPTVYLLRDRWSRYIVGFTVLLDAPSWMGAMTTLLSIGDDSQKKCLEYGIQYQPEDWPELGYPQFVVVDRAEGIGKNSDKLIERLDIYVASLPPYRGDFKGTVENGHKLVQVTIQDDTPGYKAPKLNLRGPKEHQEREAALTLSEFIAAMGRAIWRINTSRIAEYPLSVDMVRDGVLPIPVQIYAWGIRNRSGRLRRIATELVRSSLLPTAPALVTQEGIKFGNCFYTCKRAITEKWFLRASEKSWEIDVSYNPNLVDEVSWRDPAKRTLWERLKLLPDSEQYAGCSFQEVEVNELRKSALFDAAGQTSMERAVAHLDKNDEVFGAARKARQLASPQNKAKNHATKNVVESRALEQKVVRKAQSVKLSLVGADGPREQATDVDEEAPRMDGEPIPGSMAAKLKSFHAKIIDGDAL